MGLRWKGGERERDVATNSDYTHWRKRVEEEVMDYTQRGKGKELSGEKVRRRGRGKGGISSGGRRIEIEKETRTGGKRRRLVRKPFLTYM